MAQRAEKEEKVREEQERKREKKERMLQKARVRPLPLSIFHSGWRGHSLWSGESTIARGAI